MDAVIHFLSHTCAVLFTGSKLTEHSLTINDLWDCYYGVDNNDHHIPICFLIYRWEQIEFFQQNLPMKTWLNDSNCDTTLWPIIRLCSIHYGDMCTSCNYVANGWTSFSNIPEGTCESIYRVKPRWLILYYACLLAVWRWSKYLWLCHGHQWWLIFYLICRASFSMSYCT